MWTKTKLSQKDLTGIISLTENKLNPNRSPSRSPSPGSDSSPRLSKRSANLRRSASPSSPNLGSRRGSTNGYEQYQKSLLEVPFCFDYGDPSSDDLSSEWDSDVADPPPKETKVDKIYDKLAPLRLLLLIIKSTSVSSVKEQH